MKSWIPVTVIRFKFNEIQLNSDWNTLKTECISWNLIDIRLKSSKVRYKTPENLQEFTKNSIKSDWSLLESNRYPLKSG